MPSMASLRVSEGPSACSEQHVTVWHRDVGDWGPTVAKLQKLCEAEG